LYIDASRPDFLFADELPILLVSPNDPPFAGAVGPEGGVPDSGETVYLGTLLVRASVNARGTFTVDLLRDLDLNNQHFTFTFVNDQDGLDIENLNFIPATINLCPIVDSPNDCNGDGFPDECEPDDDGDGMINDCDPCPIDPANDSDGDGVCDSDDGCPLDPNKTSPGLCGCGLLDSGDSDGDGVFDCVDQCPGVDDGQFAPGCLAAIPAASTWGLLVLTLLLLVGAKTAFSKPQARFVT